jgi:uncharacterized cofD-like protein
MSTGVAGERRHDDRILRAVAIGGGHGLSRSLTALREVVDEVTAVVTVADDGGSSGRLRQDLGVLPPGDLRMALAALARDERLAELIQYRFDRGELAGHSLGNLIIVALRDLEGDVVAGLDRLARLVAAPGRVLPCCAGPVDLHGRTGRGELTGQAEIAGTPGLEEVWLAPADQPATPGVVDAITTADLVVLGPGSLFTSLLPNLLVEQVADAVRERRGPTVLVGNLREQPGETEGMGLVDHLEAIERHVGRLHLDALIAHDGPYPSGPGKPLAVDPDELAPYVGRLLLRDLVNGADEHDPVALAAAFRQLLHP